MPTRVPSSITRSIAVSSGLLPRIAATCANVLPVKGLSDGTPLKFSIVTTDIVVLAVALSVALGIGAGALAAWRLVRTPPLTLLGR